MKIDGNRWIGHCQKRITACGIPAMPPWPRRFLLNAIIRAHKEQSGSIGL